MFSRAPLCPVAMLVQHVATLCCSSNRLLQECSETHWTSFCLSSLLTPPSYSFRTSKKRRNSQIVFDIALINIIPNLELFGSVRCVLYSFYIFSLALAQFYSYQLVGLGGLGVTCSPRDPRFAGSHPAEVDGVFQDVKILNTSPPGATLSHGSRV